MPTLRKKFDGRYFIDDRIDGTRRRITLTQTVNGRREPIRDSYLAEQIYAAYLAEREEQTPSRVINQENPPVADILAYYLNEYLPAKNAAHKTVTAARKHISDFLNFLSHEHIGRVQQLAPRVLQRYAAKLAANGKHPTTVKNYLVTIRAALNAAVDAEVVPQSPIRKWTLPKSSNAEIHPLSMQELNHVLSIITKDHPILAPIIHWIAYTGNRPSDAVDLRHGQIDVKTRHVTRISVKVKALRQYEISPQAAQIIIREREAHSDWGTNSHAFIDLRGVPWTVNRVYHEMRRTLERASFPRICGPKLLRHTFASIMANEIQCPLPVLRVLMGHTDIKTTMRYVRATSGAPYLEAWDDLSAKTRRFPQNRGTEGHQNA